jgi:dihydrolipoamide dehydrogenase
MEIDKDIVVIGGGPAGYVAAIRAASYGAKVVLVEKNLLGGTCLNYGCIPTKTLAKSANNYSSIKKSDELSFNVGELKVNFKKVIDRKRNVIGELRNGIHDLLLYNQIDLVEGEAFIKNKNEIEVLNGSGDLKSVKASKLIITTGSVYNELPDLKFDSELVISSEDILELEKLPKTLMVIGGGVIGAELASIYAQFGVQVHLVEIQPEILPNLDPDVTDFLKQEMSGNGIKFYTSASVKEVSRVKKGATVKLKVKNDEELEVSVEKILVVTGRKPNLEIKGLETLGLVIVDGAISVNSKMETNIKGIYAAGDVTGGYQLAHVAYHEGIVAAENCLGKDRSISYENIPQCIYTNPEVGLVGLTERNANEKNIDVLVVKAPFSANGKAIASNETSGFIKLIVDKKYNELLGVQIVGASATELIQQAVIAVNLEVTLDELENYVFAHPTLSESFWEASMLALKHPIHLAI